MKRITLALTLALGCMMTNQSFGFDLLDRMLGSKGCGCDTACCADPSCGSEAPCCAADPACGCEAPSCGCDSGCGLKGGLLSGLKGCGSQPTCGCESACPCEPACGAEPACCDSGCGCGKKHGGLLKKLFGKKCGKGCDSGCEPACGAESACGCADPACGCEAPSCDSGCGCGPKKGGLLSKLFGGCKSSSCCDMGCDSGCTSGCGSPTMAPTMAPEVESAPAPIVDPSAYNQGKRRVVQASARYVR